MAQGLRVLGAVIAGLLVGATLLWLVPLGIAYLDGDKAIAMWVLSDFWHHPLRGYWWVVAIYERIDSGLRLAAAVPAVALGAGASASIWHVSGRLAAGTWRDALVRGSRVVSSDDIPAKRLYYRWKGERGWKDNLKVGGVPIAVEAEVQHVLISGATGTGKSQIMDGFLRTLRARGARCLVIDHSGGALSRHGGPEDWLLNPFDRRSVAWSPFAEIFNEYDYRRIANAIIPDPIDGAGDKAEWLRYGQGLLADLLRVLKLRGEESPRELHRWISAAGPTELRKVLAGTTSAIFSEPANAKLLGSVRGVITPYVRFLEHLPAAGNRFSVRKWIQDETDRGWLFLTYKEDQLDELRQFLSCVSAVAMVEALSLRESDQRRLFFFLDELATLGHLGRVPDILTKLRKNGGCVVLSVQVLSQLRAIYGRDVAQAIIGNAATKVILRQDDEETAKAWERQLGEREVKRLTGSQSQNRPGGFGRRSEGTSVTTQIVRESVVMASELQGLPDLKGIISRTGKPHTWFAVEYVAMPARYEGFVPKGSR